MKKIYFFFLSFLIFGIAIGQYNRPFLIDQYSSNCYKVFRQNKSGNPLQYLLKFDYVDTCSLASGSFDLLAFDSSTKYFRNGVSTWYFDTVFEKPKAIIPFYLGVPYGYIKMFHPNGNLKYEGACKTIRYVPANNEKLIFRIDQKDTIFITDQGRQTIDSIKAISKYSFVDPITYETASNEKGSDLIIIAWPFYQKQKVGLWKYYDEKGTLLRKEWYAMGKPIKQ